MLLALLISMSSWGASAELSQGTTYYRLSPKKDATKNMIFIHDKQFSSWTWTLTAPRLKKSGFNTVVYDQYGFGKSDRLDVRRYDRNIMMNQLRDLVIHLNWQDQPLYLVGSGTGAGIAASYANRFDHVKKIVMLSPAYNLYTVHGDISSFLVDKVRKHSDSFITQIILQKAVDKAVDRFVAKLEGSTKTAVNVFIKKETQAEDYVDTMIRVLRGDLYQSFGNEYKKLNRKNISVLVTAARDDQNISSGQLSRLKQGASFQVVEFDTGSEYVVTESKEVLEAIKAFLAAE